MKTEGVADLIVTFNVEERRQQIQGFGASDSWSIQHIGMWPEEKRDAIADLLFSTELDGEGSPKGIGLSHWRFYIGTGTSRDNDRNTRIRDPWRRADTFYTDDFSAYDWERQEGQRRFLQAAKARGVKQFTAYAISPPVTMTRNGLAYCDPSVGSTNLRDDKIEAYAVFLADVVKHFRDNEEIAFDYISPFNEPQWDWNDKSQEGCRYGVADMKPVVAALSEALIARQLDTNIMVCDSGELQDLYGMRRHDHDYARSFFDPAEDTFLGDYPNVARTISGHSYFSCWPGTLTRTRQGLREAMSRRALDFAMTEFCILLPDAFWMPEQYRGWGNGRDLGIDPALWVARVIHHDLVVAGAVSWEWWLGVSPYDYKDGLVYCDKSETDGNYYPSKMLWGMGNFSRFIRPGMFNIELERSDNKTHSEVEEGLMASGYYSVEQDVAVLVFVNCASREYRVGIRMLNAPVAEQPVQWIPYVTAGNHMSADNLTPYDMLESDGTFTIPPRAIVTFVSQQ